MDTFSTVCGVYDCHNFWILLYFFQMLCRPMARGTPMTPRRRVGCRRTPWRWTRWATCARRWRSSTWRGDKRRYRVTHQLVANIPLTSKQQFCFGLGWHGPNRTFVMMSTGGSSQPVVSPCMSILGHFPMSEWAGRCSRQQVKNDLSSVHFCQNRVHPLPQNVSAIWARAC